MERQQVLEALQERIQAEGGKVIRTVKSLAEELGEKQERLYYLIREFEKKGQISTTSHGPNGMEFRAGTGEPKVPSAGRGVRRRGVVAAGAQKSVALGGSRASGTARNFCPYCGQKAESDWRFCASCGESLPAAR